MTRLGRSLLYGWARGDARRANCVLERLCEDHSLGEIAERHGVDKATVHRWVAEFREVCRGYCVVESLEPGELVMAV